MLFSSSQVELLLLDFIMSGAFPFGARLGLVFVWLLPLTVLPFFCLRVCGFGGFFLGVGGGAVLGFSQLF
jgi:hypothetical protein